MIIYTEEKLFTQQQVHALFASVGWLSADYPSRLYKALMHSDTVMTAWDGGELVGLARVIDDSELVAYMHYVLVRPDHQGQHIAAELVKRVVEKYKNYLYIELMPEERKNAAFYEKFGFSVMEDGAPMQRCNFDGKY